MSETNSQDLHVGGLNRNQIKYILILAMLIDHIAWAFVKEATPAWEVMHFFGRLTGPGMAFFLAEGFLHTRDVKKYTRRLGIFAFLSWPAFVYFGHGRPVISIIESGFAMKYSYITIPLLDSGKAILFYWRFGIIYTLFLALVFLRVWTDATMDPVRQSRLLVLLLVLSIFGDWPGFVVLFAWIFYTHRDRPKVMWFLYCLVALFCFEFTGLNLKGIYSLGVLLVPLLMHFYNGERGSAHPFHKWVFYIFYPLHLLILGYLRWN
ncbi:MAG: hypothetical protein IK078_10340 [Lachnospiraceae bacterium]|nr:hypothetical protein [Lachnospiraceae bacterium]